MTHSIMPAISSAALPAEEAPIGRLPLEVLGQVYSNLEDRDRQSFAQVNREWNWVAKAQTVLEFCQFVEQQGGLTVQNHGASNWRHATTFLRSWVSDLKKLPPHTGMTAHKIRLAARHCLAPLAALIQEKRTGPRGNPLRPHDFVEMSQFQQKLAQRLSEHLDKPSFSVGQCLGFFASAAISQEEWDAILGSCDDSHDELIDLFRSLSLFFLGANKDAQALAMALRQVTLQQNEFNEFPDLRGNSSLCAILSKLLANGKLNEVVKIVEDIPDGNVLSVLFPFLEHLFKGKGEEEINEFIEKMKSEKMKSVLISVYSLSPSVNPGVPENILTVDANYSIQGDSFQVIDFFSRGETKKAIELAERSEDDIKEKIVYGLVLRGMMQEAIDLAARHHLDELLFHIVKSFLFVGNKEKAIEVSQRIADDRLFSAAHDDIDRCRPMRHARRKSISLDHVRTENLESAVDKAKQTLKGEKLSKFFQDAWCVTVMQGEVDRALSIAEKISDPQLRQMTLLHTANILFYGGFTEKACQVLLQMNPDDEALTALLKIGDFLASQWGPEVFSQHIRRIRDKGFVLPREMVDALLDQRAGMQINDNLERALATAMAIESPEVKERRLADIVENACCTMEGKLLLAFLRKIPLDVLSAEGTGEVCVLFLSFGEIEEAKTLVRAAMPKWIFVPNKVLYLLLLKGEIDLAVELVKQTKDNKVFETIVDFYLTKGDLNKAIEMAKAIPEGERKERVLKRLRM